MNNKIKIAVIGSCVTRDLFNSKFINNYKDFYECVSTVWQTSMISFMSEPSTLDDSLIELDGDVTKLQRNTLLRDLDKSYKDEIINKQPDYIIFDLYTDVKYGAIRTKKNTYLTNNPNGFRKTKYFKEQHFEEALNVFKDKDYLNL